MASWKFNAQKAGITIREAVQGEFFSTDAIKNIASALVREAVQNSLDASLADFDPEKYKGKPVTVRFHLSDNVHYDPDIQKYFTGVLEHYEAPPNNNLLEIPHDLRHGVSDPKIQYLVFEDFGTTGLSGDPMQWNKPDGVSNNFYNFYRHEGQSDKLGGNRGRWGVGKFVFPLSSKLKTFFGLTKRGDDGRSLLFGKSILRSHSIKRKTYYPDGFFGLESEDLKMSDLMIPVEDNDYLSDFCKIFNLQRGDDSGLSIVIPWHQDDICKISLLCALIEEYFLPILSKKLVAIVEYAGTKITLDSSNLMEESFKIKEHLMRGMLSLIELANWSAGLKAEDKFLFEKMAETGEPKWGPCLFPNETQAELMRKKYFDGENICVRVPFIVRPKNGAKEWSYFDVFLRRDQDSLRDRPLYVREGLVISDLRCPANSGCLSLVLIEDKPLSTLLGDAENPAHTQWQKDGSQYRIKYQFSVENISFVINSVSQIIRFITEADKELDETILKDVFFLPDSDSGSGPGPGSGSGSGSGSKKIRPKPPKLSPKPKPFKIQKIKNGFKVIPEDTSIAHPDKLLIQVAYATRGTNPLKDWKEFDFALDKSPIKIVNKGMDFFIAPKIKDKKSYIQKKNTIKAVIKSNDFCLELSGFDDKRDLYVKVLLNFKEELNDDITD